MISFNIPPFVGTELMHIETAIKNHRICGDGHFNKKCMAFIEELTGTRRCFLTTSCTHALEMSAILAGIQPGDEVIMPSYTFVSTADAFVLRGAVPVFVDIRPDTMNIDENLIEDAITEKTKAIVPVHYAGVGCEMDKITAIADKHKLFVIEDAAQAMSAKYKGKHLGTIGDFGSYSFHETKNYSMGEGGALLIKDEQFVESAEIIREKGTDRSKFFRGQVDKYRWVDFGSSYLPSELNAAYLWAQFEKINDIYDNRMRAWNRYNDAFKELQKKGALELPFIPEHCEHNAHMYYMKTDDLNTRTKLLDHLKAHDILSVFHYVPLHSAPAGLKYGRFSGTDRYTTKESERLFRLPMYYNISDDDIDKVIGTVYSFFD